MFDNHHIPSSRLPGRYVCSLAEKSDLGVAAKLPTAKVDPTLINPCSLILWVDEIRFAPLCNHGKPLVVGIYRGIESFQGFLGGAKWISQPSTVWVWVKIKPGNGPQEFWSTFPLSRVHVGYPFFDPQPYVGVPGFSGDSSLLEGTPPCE